MSREIQQSNKAPRHHNDNFESDKRFIETVAELRITYLYYGNAQGAIDGVVNLTITSFGEAVYWFGRKFYFIASLIF
ncbi:hypothetical protein AAH145_26365, partial [Bacteroides thetaiotaomicron]